MSKKVAVFWPGDYRAKPNEWALPQSRETTEQLVAALRKLGRSPYLVEGYLTRPDEAIAKLGPIDDPMVGVFVHWAYAPHTVDGVVGKDNPLLLASNFSGTWPGLVALLNTGASLESVGRHASRVWTDAADWTADARFMERLDEWCSTGRIGYDTSELHERRPPIAPDAVAIGRGASWPQIRGKRVLALMLGDTSMGMINGYFGPRLLYPIGFTEHKVDQAWLIDRVRSVADAPGRRRLPVRQGRGRHLPLGRGRRRGLHARVDPRAAPRLPRRARPARRVQGRLPRLAVPARPPQPLAAQRLRRGAAELARPARGERPRRHHQHRGRPGQPRADGADEAAPRGEGAARRGDVPRRPLGGRARGPLPLGPAQLRELRGLRLQPRRRTRSRASTATASRRAISPSRAARSPA